MQMTNFSTGKCLSALLVGFWLTLGLTLPGLADDEARKVVVDAAGNVYVTGNSGNGVNNDYVTIKYNASGNWLWGRRYNGPANGDDEPTSLTVDAAGNVYVTGHSSNGANDDYVTIKYDTNGNWLWGRRYNGPANGDDEPTSLTVDAAGNVYVTGYSSNGTYDDAKAYDCVTIKYNSSGVWVWGQRYNGLADNDDGAKALGVDASGNVYVAGYSYSASNCDYITIKYSSAGAWVWGRRYNSPFNAFDAAYYMAVDAAGNVNVTGTSSNYYGFASYDYVTIKYDTNGNWLWGQRYNGPANDLDSPRGLAVDAAGNVYVTGRSTSSGKYDYVTIKYSSAGAWVWGRRYNSPFNDFDVPNGLAVDSSGSVYVTGSSHNGANDDYVTIKYSPTGTWIWGARYDGPD